MLVMDRERLRGAPLERRGRRAAIDAGHPARPARPPPRRRTRRRDEQHRQPRERVPAHVAARRLTPRSSYASPRAVGVAGALVEPAERELLARLAARVGSLLRQPQRVRHHRRQRQQIVTVVIEHARDHRRVAGAQEVKVARGNLEARHVAEPMEAEHGALERRQAAARAASSSPPTLGSAPGALRRLRPPEPARRRQHVEVRQVVGRRRRCDETPSASPSTARRTSGR